MVDGLTQQVGWTCGLEFVKQPGEVGVLIGQGQTAQVLRNLCYQVHEERRHRDKLVRHIQTLFDVERLPPRYIAERGEIVMSYRDENGRDLGLSSSGRELRQTLLLLAQLYANPGAVLLPDQPDARLERLRQRQIDNLLIHIGAQQGWKR